MDIPALGRITFSMAIFSINFFNLGIITSSCLAAYKDPPSADQDEVILP